MFTTGVSFVNKNPAIRKKSILLYPVQIQLVLPFSVETY